VLVTDVSEVKPDASKFNLLCSCPKYSVFWVELELHHCPNYMVVVHLFIILVILIPLPFVPLLLLIHVL